MIIKICDGCGMTLKDDDYKVLLLAGRNPVYGCKETNTYHLCDTCSNKLKHAFRPRNIDDTNRFKGNPF